MPIKGMTNRDLAFPTIGQIRKGSKKTSNAPGRDLTYFRVVFDELEKESERVFNLYYDNEPRSIRIILPFNDIDRVWDAWLEAYTAGRMVARSDGEFVQFATDGITGEIIVKNGVSIATGQPVPHPADNIAGYDYKDRPIEYKHHGRLKVIIPELERAAYLTVITTGKWDVANMDAELRGFHALNNGQIAGIPLIILRKPEEKPVTINGKRVRKIFWNIHIEAASDWMRGKFNDLMRQALPDVVDGEALALPEHATLVDEAENIGGVVVETSDLPPVVAENVKQEFGKDMNANDFWDVVYNELNLTPSAGKKALQDSGGCFDVALETLKKQVKK